MKVWYKRKTVWFGLALGAVKILEACGVIPPAVVEALIGILGAGGVVSLRSAVASEAQAAKK